MIIVALFATRFIVHESIRGGMMGLMLVVSVIPVLSLALVVWAAATRGIATGPRRAWMVARRADGDGPTGSCRDS